MASYALTPSVLQSAPSSTAGAHLPGFRLSCVRVGEETEGESAMQPRQLGSGASAWPVYSASLTSPMHRKYCLRAGTPEILEALLSEDTLGPTLSGPVSCQGHFQKEPTVYREAQGRDEVNYVQEETSTGEALAGGGVL